MNKSFHMMPNGRFINGTPRRCPDGTYVGDGGPVRMAPDGSFVVGPPRMAPDGTYL